MKRNRKQLSASMKGIFIFNHLNDVSFMHVDDEYKEHLNTIMVDKEVDPEAEDDNVVIPGPVMSN